MGENSERRRMEAIVGREGKDGKTYWTKLGVAFPTKSGHLEVRLDAMPAPGSDGFRFLLVDAERRKTAAPGTDPDSPLDDVPF